MARTTVNIDTPILGEIKNLQQTEGKSLGQLISELLSEALGHRRRQLVRRDNLDWTTQDMGALIDVADKEALYAALEHESP
jgi:uncharacterized protein with von Willebrand factor type A (vWA) domain